MSEVYGVATFRLPRLRQPSAAVAPYLAAIALPLLLMMIMVMFMCTGSVGMIVDVH